MNQEKIKIEAYNEAQEIVNKYAHEKRSLSLKQKALLKKNKKLVEEYEAQIQQEQAEGDKKSKKKQKDLAAGEGRFNQDSHSIFDTKKGQVLFELQKSYKGDDRFRLDKRFAEDIDAKKLPNSLKLLSTGIDFQNLSDGSDYEFKKKQSKQKKLQKKQEKQLQQAQKINALEQASSDNDSSDEDEAKEVKQLSMEKEQAFSGFHQNNENDDSDSGSDFFRIKVHKEEASEQEGEEEQQDEEVSTKQSKDKNKKQLNEGKKKSAELKKRKRSISIQIDSENDIEGEDQEEVEEEEDGYDLNQGAMCNEEDLQDDDGGKEYRKAYRIAKDFIDQEALVDDEDEITMEEELHNYLKILQDLMPNEKLFLQNKKKNVKVNYNSFAGYATMLTQEETQQIAGKKKKKSKEERMRSKEENIGEDNIEDEGEQNGEDADSSLKKKKSGFDKDFDDSDDEFGSQKRERAYNLVIPRFDPSQLVVKKVMQAQEREKMEKLRELESKKKPKKQSVEARIEAGIDKKLQKIMKANSILDKNLTEHKKLEGVEQVKKKAPVLKKIKIDADKWRNIINESGHHGDEKQAEENTVAQQPKQSQQNGQNNTSHKQPPAVVQKTRQPLHKMGPSSLGMLFASVPATVEGDTSRSQFKLFG